MSMGYFGKLPASSDFVRSAGHHVLSELLDQWLAAVMQRLAANPRWRQHYDVFPPLHFAFIGTRQRHAVAGHLLASCDAARRRFPFVYMQTQAVEDASDFLACAPLALAPVWTHMGACAMKARLDKTSTLERPGCEPDLVAAHAAVKAYLAGETLDGLRRGMGGLAPERLLLAFGLLLEQLRGKAAPGRCLALPLPLDGQDGPAVAAFWMALALPMLARCDLELAVFMTRLAGCPALVLGLDGANPAALQAIIDPDAADEVLVRVEQAEWVATALAGRAPLQRLHACLAQGELHLDAALKLFRETFS